MSRGRALSALLRDVGVDVSSPATRLHFARGRDVVAEPASDQKACAAHVFQPSKGGRRCRWCGARPDGRITVRSVVAGRVRLVPSEAVEQRGIIDLLVAAGCRYGTKKDQETDIYVLGTKRSRYLPNLAHKTRQTPGIPDLYTFLPRVRKIELPTLPPAAVWIEVKALDGRSSPAQERFAERAQLRDIPYLIGGVDVVRRFLEKHGFLRGSRN